MSALTFEVPPGTPVRSCMSCGQRIYWIETRSGKRMPVNADGFESHFASCPKADEHRGNPRQPSLFQNDGGRKA